ncbi:putative transmembrane protein 183BP isoform X2 [Crassostrea angulata]|uniref:putative transmembrane protein 183BP isoform X2 n=1 Tax=Magallana angulata TaxID=2784310 RepID=UPI0022B11C5E|nr:putative transmembrane protein 183BP isoform X2 [Crassostrea angulata]
MRKKFRNKHRKNKVRNNQCVISKDPGIQNDVTLCDYADSSKTPISDSVRVKKAISSIATNIKYQRKDMNTDNSDLSWFEKDLEDFDVLDDVGEENSDEDDTTKTETKALRPRKKCKEKEENVGRHVYPVDIWFTLAAYIDPEAVRNFATLCKDSYLVTRTRQFWKNLYTRSARKVVSTVSAFILTHQ